MASIETIKTQILSIIQDDNFSISQLEIILNPIGSFFTNSAFFNNITGVVNIITKDRNGDNKFDMADLTLLSGDMPAVTSLLGSIMLLISSLPSVGIQYNAASAGELVFKILSYIFLVVIPKQTGNPLSIDEKTTAVNIAASVYELANSSQIITDIINQIVAWFKSKGYCACMTAPVDPDTIIAKHLPSFKRDLSHAVCNIREKSQLKREIKLLHHKLNKQKKLINKPSTKNK